MIFYPNGAVSLGELIEIMMVIGDLDITELSNKSGVPPEQIRRLITNTDPGIPNHLLRLMKVLNLCIIEKPDSN